MGKKVRVLDVVLSNPHGVYLAGQVLQGHVTLDLAEPIKLKGLRITFRGRAFVHWTEQLMRGPGESRFREIRHHAATEDYFHFTQDLLNKGSNSSGEKRVLAAGEYTYPFQFALPPSLPCSFEGQHGHVRFWVKVTLEKSWHHDYVAKRVFSVIAPFDLNRQPAASNSVQNAKQKNLCCLCCRSGPVSALLCVTQKGFVPGEAIHINAEIINHSRQKMGTSSVELKMTTVFRTPHKTRALTRLIGKIKRGQIPAGETDVWSGEKLVLPPLPPSGLQGCGIIDVKYTLELRVEPVGPSFELCVPVEILVGTVPLQSCVQRYINHRLTPPLNLRHAPSLPASPPRLPRLAPPPVGHGPVTGPPSGFAPYVFGGACVRDSEVEDSHYRGDSHFTPAYAFYLFDQASSACLAQQDM